MTDKYERALKIIMEDLELKVDELQGAVNLFTTRMDKEVNGLRAQVDTLVKLIQSDIDEQK